MIAVDPFADLMTRLCPMHVLLDGNGRIVGAGPTLQKLRPLKPMAGQGFLDLFEPTRPRGVVSVGDLLAAPGGKMHLRFRDPPLTALKGIAAPWPGRDGAVINLSFGISVLDAVRDYDLTSADFPFTDLAIELLYLVEAKSAAMEASRKLNLRLQGAMIAAEERAYTDTLTGLKNRRAADHVLARLTGAGVPFGLMHMDLDFFKAVNDGMGHAAGDHVLQQVARIMVAETREEDTVARVGGDEFLLILHRQTDGSRLARIARRLIARLEEPIPYGDRVCRISSSIGIVTSPAGGGLAPGTLMHRADLALYAAKRGGRGCLRFHDDLSEAERMMPVPCGEPETPAMAGRPAGRLRPP
jgi:diguanylate cyclase (GGDEF)-like protein